MTSTTAFLANNGAIGGGEVMLIRMACAAQSLGSQVCVVGPATPSGLAQACREEQLPYVNVRGSNRVSYMFNLQFAIRSLGPAMLWCNGIIPALGTSFCRQQRVIHIHQIPTRTQDILRRVASGRALATVVPSQYTQERLHGGVSLANWTGPMSPMTTVHPRPLVTIGYLGRLSAKKGLNVLADAMALLLRRRPGKFRLAIGGDDRFVPKRDANRVRQHLAGLGDAVTNLGWVAPAELVGRVDLLVMPSLAAETFGLVAAEAMALGLPLIVSDAGALPEVVGSDYPWIFRRGDAPALARMIERMADDGSAVWEAAERARNRWLKLFSPAAGRQRFCALLLSLGLDLDVAAGGEGARDG